MSAIWEELTSFQIKAAEQIKPSISILDKGCSAEIGDVVLAVNREESPKIRFGVVCHKYPNIYSAGGYHVVTQHGINNPLGIAHAVISFGSSTVVINFTHSWRVRRAGRIILKAFRRYKAITKVLQLCVIHSLPVAPLVAAMRTLPMLKSTVLT